MIWIYDVVETKYWWQMQTIMNSLSPEVMEKRIKRKLMQVAPFTRQMNDQDNLNTMRQLWSNMEMKAFTFRFRRSRCRCR